MDIKEPQLKLKAPNICDICGWRLGRMFIIVRDEKNPDHTAKAHCCALCHELLVGDVSDGVTVEEVSQQEYNQEKSNEN
jgi:hypothetical protein